MYFILDRSLRFFEIVVFVPENFKKIVFRSSVHEKLSQISNIRISIMPPKKICILSTTKDKSRNEKVGESHSTRIPMLPFVDPRLESSHVSQIINVVLYSIVLC